MSQIYGQIKNPDGTTTFKPIRATLLPDGIGYALAVDTELVLDAASVTISNLKVGSLNQTVSGSRWLKTLDDGTVVVQLTNSSLLLDGYEVNDTISLGAFPRYHGFSNNEEDWYIIEETATTIRYFAGTGNYVAAWTGRADHSYDYYHNIF